MTRPDVRARLSALVPGDRLDRVTDLVMAMLAEAPAADTPPEPPRRQPRTQATYRPIPGGADDLAATLAAYRVAHNCDPAAILVGVAPADGIDAVDGVPVQVDPIVAKPAGYAYLEVARG